MTKDELIAKKELQKYYGPYFGTEVYLIEDSHLEKYCCLHNQEMTELAAKYFGKLVMCEKCISKMKFSKEKPVSHLMEIEKDDACFSTPSTLERLALMPNGLNPIIINYE